MIIPEAGHNLMMENNWRAIIEKIQDWLISQNIN